MAVSGVHHKHVHAGATSAVTRSSVSPPVPTAAPTRNRPHSSLQASGKSLDF
jgi:hypothetical protein